MRNPVLPGLALLLVGIGILAYYALSVVKSEREAGFGRLDTKPSSSASVPAPLAAGWIVMTGGIAWLVAGPRGVRA